MKYIFTLLCSLCIIGLFAQISFTPSSEGKTENFHSAVAMGVADMNGDGMDDIIRFSGGRQMEIEFQTAECGEFVKHSQTFVLPDVWNVAVGDVNNDGFNDLMSSGQTDNVTLFTFDPSTAKYDIKLIDNSDFFAQAANFIDINNDGWLDAFVCNDDGDNYIMMNDGSGQLITNTNIIDFTTTPSSDNSGNYGSVWGDFDSDGDIDLYIAKCRQGVNDPADPRRINSFFVNDGTGHFTDKAAEFGLAIGAQSWTADFADIDLDGDLDCFISNHDVPSQLLENLGDTTFVDITKSSKVAPFGTVIQGTFRDFDNDGWIDLLVSGSNHSLWKNNGDGTFTEMEDAFTNTQMMTFAIGDLNHDGFLDVYAGYGVPFNGTTNRDDILFYNDGNNNNYINFQLEGTTSNRNAVGARVELYTALGMQIREVRAGEGYGISLSHDLHFGIGQSTEVDSAVIKWPSGLREVFVDMSINQTHMIKEGGCMVNRMELSEACVELCDGDTVSIEAPDGFDIYTWSNGMTGQAISINNEGLFWATMKKSGDSCAVKTNAIRVKFNRDGIEKELVTDAQSDLCDGELIRITAPQSDTYLWNNGATTQTIVVSESGTYRAMLTGSCLDWQSDSIQVTFYKAELPMGINDTINFVGSAELVAVGDSIAWYADLVSQTPIYEGSQFITPEIAQTTSYFAANRLINRAQEESVGPKEHSGGSMYGGNQFNGELLFDVLAPMTIDSVTVFTDFPGPRIFEIRKSNGEIVFRTDTILVQDQKMQVYLNATLVPGLEYHFSTDLQLNNEFFGNNNPRLVRSDGGLSYPYQIDELVSINSSGFGTDWYYYFYDWKVRPADFVCESDRVEVLAVVLLDTKTKTQKITDIKMYPNPTNSSTTIISDELIGAHVNMEVINVQGKVVALETFDAFTGSYVFDAESQTPGMYIIKLHSERGTGFLKLLVQ